MAGWPPILKLEHPTPPPMAEGPTLESQATASSSLKVRVASIEDFREPSPYKEVPMNKKYIVRLTDEERKVCEAVIKDQKGKSEKLRRAQILLKADVDGPGWKDEKISEAIGCRVRTVENVRMQLVLEGFEVALQRKKRATSPTPPLLDGAGEAKLIAMRLGKPPAGYGRWTLRLLADQMVELEVVDSISPETVRKTLKKTA